MREKDSGKILNVASIAGFMPGPLMATYYATKAYVVRLSEAIREELKKEADRGAIVTTEIEMVIKIFPGKVIGITGSDGKTTTTSLTYEILKSAGHKVHLGGNIGIPLFTKLNEMPCMKRMVIIAGIKAKPSILIVKK